MSFKLFDSVKREKVEFIPIKEKRGLYLCWGPTGYERPTLGHARSGLRLTH